MAKFISILSKEKILKDKILAQTKLFQTKLNLQKEENENHFSMWEDLEYGGSGIEICFAKNSNDFNDKGILETHPEYSTIFLIKYFSEDQLIVPFLKLFTQTYPNILIFNDESSSNFKRIFEKSDLDIIKGNDYWSLLGQKLM